VLPDEQYEQALEVLRNARNALERTPSMTAHLDEEKIRDLLLVFLNAQFEGDAAGEVFNAAGKTDILIRAGDRNVFIAECKIWKGPKTIRDALGQLRSYLTWRDTKAALLVFLRSGQPTAIISKAITEIEGTPELQTDARNRRGWRAIRLRPARQRGPEQGNPAGVPALRVAGHSGPAVTGRS
jgi:hypothetical protein